MRQWASADLTQGLGAEAHSTGRCPSITVSPCGRPYRPAKGSRTLQVHQIHTLALSVQHEQTLALGPPFLLK